MSAPSSTRPLPGGTSDTTGTGHAETMRRGSIGRCPRGRSRPSHATSRTIGSTSTPRRNGRRAPPTIRSGTPPSASSWPPAPSTTISACSGARRLSSGHARRRRPTARSSTSTTSTPWTAVTRTRGAASSGASASSTVHGRRSAACWARSATCLRPIPRRNSASLPTSPTSRACRLHSDCPERWLDRRAHAAIRPLRFPAGDREARGGGRAQQDGLRGHALGGRPAAKHRAGRRRPATPFMD